MSEPIIGTGRETSGVPVQWGAPQDHAACGDAIAAARAAGARHALLSLAAEIEALNDWPKLESISDETAEYARGTTTGIAQMARRRAQDHPGAPSSTSLAQDDPELTLVGLSPAQAYEAGVKAGRQRYENAITWNTSCLSCATVLDSCYAETVRREQAEDRLAAVRELARQLGDRSKEPALPAPLVKVHLPLSDRRIVEPIRRGLLEILDGKP